LKEADGGDSCMKYTTSLNKRENYLIKYWTLVVMVPVDQYGTVSNGHLYNTTIELFPSPDIGLHVRSFERYARRLERDFDMYSVRIYLVTVVLIMIH
jgi:hypothetical protein